MATEKITFSSQNDMYSFIEKINNDYSVESGGMSNDGYYTVYIDSDKVRDAHAVATARDLRGGKSSNN